MRTGAALSARAAVAVIGLPFLVSVSRPAMVLASAPPTSGASLALPLVGQALESRRTPRGLTTWTLKSIREWETPQSSAHLPT